MRAENLIAGLAALGGRAALDGYLAESGQAAISQTTLVIASNGRRFLLSEDVSAFMSRVFAPAVISGAFRAGATATPDLGAIALRAQSMIRRRRFPDYSIAGRIRPDINPTVMLAMLEPVAHAFRRSVGDVQLSRLSAEALAQAIQIERRRVTPDDAVVLALETAFVFSKLHRHEGSV